MNQEVVPVSSLHDVSPAHWQITLTPARPDKEALPLIVLPDGGVPAALNLIRNTWTQVEATDEAAQQEALRLVLMLGLAVEFIREYSDFELAVTAGALVGATVRERFDQFLREAYQHAGLAQARNQK